MTLAALIILLAFAVYSLFSKSISRSVITLPILFTALGLALSQTLQASLPAGLIYEGKKILAEITLILVLFSDASHVRFGKLVTEWTLPARMLVIGLPLTIALGTVVAYWMHPASGWAMALFTAAVLTPTDAALGQAVVTSDKVPPHLSQTINIESGLNDGLALPFVLLGAILASTTGAAQTQGLALETLQQVILGPLTGIAVGWLAARAMDWAKSCDTMAQPAGAVVFLCTAFTAFVLAGLVGGNGFIAAFVAGMVFGNTYRHNSHTIGTFMDGEGQLLTMSAFIMFGAFLLPTGLAYATPGTVLLSLLFLTLVRMLPIFLSLVGTGLALREKLFLGWFGPRGIASILFTLLMIDQFDFPKEEAFLATVSLTVGLSILLHGLTANPLSNRIGKPPH